MCTECYENTDVGREMYARMQGFRKLYPDADFSPGHIVIGDDNIEDHDIRWCLQHWNEYLGGCDQESMLAAWCWLKYLLTIDEDTRIEAHT